MTLRRLETSDDYRVAKDSADIHGWKIVDSAGSKLGKVEGLLFEPADNRVHYAIAEIDDRCVTLPVSDLDIDENSRHVTARGYDRTRLTGLREYDETAWTEDTERAHYMEHVPETRPSDRLDYGLERFRAQMPPRIQKLEEHLRIGKHREGLGERPVTETRRVEDEFDITRPKGETVRERELTFTGTEPTEAEIRERRRRETERQARETFPPNPDQPL